ncbi:hypothetical protein ACFXKC_41670 [Streptomyces sp. NPDC059340]|uniref:hypothetical protein n=1 Tax=Streptomyces sp. NPDC059340 TaxID=3346806 RepID=UPI003676E1CA
MFWPGKLDQPHALHYLPDLARALVMPADSDASWGRAWNRPFLIEASAIETHIGQLTLTPHADAVAQTMAGHRREAENHRHAG